jgi:hypothetical protein
VASDGASVQISIVTLILLCRRMRIATRGCTSRAASSVVQVLRVPWTVIRGTRAAMMHRSKLRLPLRGSIGHPFCLGCA